MVSVTPWEVSDVVDYERLIKEFGISRITSSLLDRIKKHTGELHLMLRRGFFFAHRDLGWLLDEYEKGNKFFLYTGRGPSGPVHLGHLAVWNFTKWLQDKFDVELWFQFTDDEKFLFKRESFDTIRKWTYENMLDVIALGFDHKKTFFLIDTKHADLLYKEAIKFAKKITLSSVKAVFGFNDSNNIGQIFYTCMQAVPAILPSVLKGKNIPCLIPLAVDQDPHFRLARDIYPKLGFYKPAIIHSKFFPSLFGVNYKMSTTNKNLATIFITDTPEEVEKKIMKYAFSGGQPSIKEHRRKGGNPDVDVSFQYLKLFFEPDDSKLKRLEEDYRSGDLLTYELKEYLIKKITHFLKEHQKRRAKAEKVIDRFIFDKREFVISKG